MRDLPDPGQIDPQPGCDRHGWYNALSEGRTEGSLRPASSSGCGKSGGNPCIATGAIEIRVKETRILSESETPPFHIVENSNTKEDLRLKYRSLDLRRPDMQRRLILRSQMMQNMRELKRMQIVGNVEIPKEAFMNVLKLDAGN